MTYLRHAWSVGDRERALSIQRSLQRNGKLLTYVSPKDIVVDDNL